MSEQAKPNESVEQEIARLRAENEALKAAKPAAKHGFKVTEKGGISVYGMGRFPVTLYPSQWVQLIEKVPALIQFMKENEAKLATLEKKTA